MKVYALTFAHEMDQSHKIAIFGHHSKHFFKSWETWKSSKHKRKFNIVLSYELILPTISVRNFKADPTSQ